MKISITLGALLALASLTPGFAGPCSQRIADLERTMEASTGEGSRAAAAPSKAAADTKGASEGMNMLTQAKELDRQGKEQECMDVVAKVATTKAPLQNQ